MIGRVVVVVVAFRAAAAILASFAVFGIVSSIILLFFVILVGVGRFLAFARRQLGALFTGDGLLIADLG